ncbi:MAG: hypothetical protein V1758_04370 [Pseudomonadota bacterium]
MKKTIGLLVTVVFVFVGPVLLYPGGSLAKEKTPTVEVSGPVKMVKKASVTIIGKGFKPGQEISILLTDNDGIQSDIGYALDPEPKADASGAWSTKWSCSDFIRRKMVKADKPYNLTVADSDYNPLASTTLSFLEEKK